MLYEELLTSSKELFVRDLKIPALQVRSHR